MNVERRDPFVPRLTRVRPLDDDEIAVGVRRVGRLRAKRRSSGRMSPGRSYSRRRSPGRPTEIHATRSRQPRGSPRVGPVVRRDRGATPCFSRCAHDQGDARGPFHRPAVFGSGSPPAPARTPMCAETEHPSVLGVEASRGVTSNSRGRGVGAADTAVGARRRGGRERAPVDPRGVAGPLTATSRTARPLHQTQPAGVRRNAPVARSGLMSSFAAMVAELYEYLLVGTVPRCRWSLSTSRRES